MLHTHTYALSLSLPFAARPFYARLLCIDGGTMEQVSFYLRVASGRTCLSRYLPLHMTSMCVEAYRSQCQLFTEKRPTMPVNGSIVSICECKLVMRQRSVWKWYNTLAYTSQPQCRNIFISLTKCENVKHRMHLLYQESRPTKFRYI